MKKRFILRVIAVCLCIVCLMPTAFAGSVVKTSKTKAPARVTVSSVKTNGKGSIVIKYKAVDYATSYKIMRKTAKSKWKVIATTAKTDYKDSTAKKGCVYYYTVAGYNKNAKKTGKYDTKGKAAVNLGLATIKSYIAKNYAICIKWTAVSGADGYSVYRKTADGDWKKLANTKKTSYTDKTGKKGSTYYYSIKPYTVSGETKYYGVLGNTAKIKIVKTKSETKITAAKTETKKTASNICSKCSGSGKVLCITCAGTGLKTTICYNCGGTGMKQTNCYSCGGTGMKSQTMMRTDPISGMMMPYTTMMPCGSCSGGKIYMSCTSCSGGKTNGICTACSGGKTICPLCAGTGKS